jgi:uncharacterized protein with beta-barrel porin domain
MSPKIAFGLSAILLGMGTSAARADCNPDASGTIICTGTSDPNLLRGPTTVINQGIIDKPAGVSGILITGTGTTFTNAPGAIILGASPSLIATVGDRDTRIINQGVIDGVTGNQVSAITFGSISFSTFPILDNSGTISSNLAAISTFGGVSGMVLNNTGTINGSILLGGINHTLNFGDGSTVNGVIVRQINQTGGARGNENGTDVVNLTGSGLFNGGFQGPFDRLTMNGTNWTLRGSGNFTDVAFNSGTFRLENGTLQIGNLASIASGATLLVQPSGVLEGAAQVAGTLVANGTSPNASVTVQGPSGLVSGTGSLGSLTVGSGGTVAPGNGLGTLTAASYTAAPGATLRISLGGTQASMLSVTGAASLAGNLQVLPATTSAVPVDGAVYTVVQAASLTGRFSALNQPFAFFTLSDRYTATTAQILATQLAFNNPKATSNIRNLSTGGQALDRYVAAAGPVPPAMTTTPAPPPAGATAPRNTDLDAISNQLLAMSPSAANVALHSVSGESYAAFTTVALEQMDVFRSTALDAAGACEARGGLVQGRVCSWLDVSRLNGNLRGSGDLAGFKYSLTGIQGGAEARLATGTILGMTLGYGHQRLSDFEYASRNLRGDAGFLGAHAAHQWGQLQLVGLGGFSLFDNSATRNITVGNISRQAQASYGGQGVTAASALRWWTEWGGIRVAPEAIIAYGQYWQNGFTETGAGSLNLRVRSSDAQSLVTGIGVRADSRFELGGVTLRPSALLRYEHAWIGGARDDHKITASFAEVPASGSWTVYGQNRGSDAAILRLGISADITSGIAVFGGVTGQWRSTGTEWGGGFGLRVQF